MWGNISGAVGAAIQKVQKIQNELESQMDAAVGNDTSNSITETVSANNSASNSVLANNKQSPTATTTDATRNDAAIGNSDESSTQASDDASSSGSIPADTIEKPRRSRKSANGDGVSSSNSICNTSVTNGQVGQQFSAESVPATLNSRTEEQHKAELKALEEKYQKKLEAMREKMESLKLESMRSVEAATEKALAAKESLKQLQADFSARNDELSSKANERERKMSEEVALLKLENERLTSMSVKGDDTPLESIREDYEQRLLQLNKSLLAAEGDKKVSEEKLSRSEREKEALSTDVTKYQEIIRERERALETANNSMAETNKLYQDSLKRIADLSSELAQKDAMNRQLQHSSADESETKRHLIKAQEMLKEKQERLAAFEEEGQRLAKKQSEMEKTVRKSKSEMREKEAEIGKLKESKEQLVKAIEEMQDLLKKHEADAISSAKSLTAMQAVSQASADKLSKLEGELSARNEELASQRRALESSWNENNELKRLTAELRADRDDLRRQLGEGTSKVIETESSRRDIEQREAVLRATNKQLQDSLQRQMQESSGREERIREELNEMRKRWQEAISSREGMAAELGNATAPLLRQISSLQEMIRVKGEQWQSIESSLSERAMRAENNSEVAEHKKSLLEEQFAILKQQHSALNHRFQELQNQLHNYEALSEKLKKMESSWNEEKAELNSKLQLEIGHRQSLQASLRELEMRHKIEMQESVESLTTQATQRELELSKLRKDLEGLQEELSWEKSTKRSKGKSTVKSPKPITSNSSDGNGYNGGTVEERADTNYGTVPDNLPSMLVV